MQYAKLLDVDETLVDALWERVKDSSGFYSIGDGVTKHVFRRELFQSNYVFDIGDGIARLNDHISYFELHPIIFGHSVLRNAKQILGEIGLFVSKPIHCIIPRELDSLKRLAKKAEMVYERTLTRSLSGNLVTCDVYIWRQENVEP